MITVKDLVKNFGDIKAVNSISFQVHRGEVLGFLGPNGAGKSTTMKMLTCFLSPTSGMIEVDGISLEKPEEIKKRIGYLPETSPSYADMNVTEFLLFIGEIRGYQEPELSSRVEAVIQKCFLQKVRHQTIDTLSKGYRQRVGVAQAILHDPPILILDEPTDGLDPNQKHEIRNLIRSMAKDKCIILSTHILEEVEEVCTRAIVIAGGKIVADGTPESIRMGSASYNQVDLKVAGVTQSAALSKIKNLGMVESVEPLSSEGDLVQSFRIRPKGKDSILAQVAELARKENWSLESLSSSRGRLDEVFRSITSEVSQ